MWQSEANTFTARTHSALKEIFGRMSKTSIPFESQVMGSFEPRKLLSPPQPGDGTITSLDFDDSGNSCVSSSTDDFLRVWDTKTGRFENQIGSKKYGCNLARFVHDPGMCVYASTKEDDTVRYLALKTNQYVRYFKGHEDRVSSLEVSPTNETIISADVGGSLRIWDVRSPNCSGLLSGGKELLAAIDATGLVFAVASQELETVAFYDMRHFDRQPFQTFKCSVSYAPKARWKKIEFGNNGKHFVVSTDGAAHNLFDGFSGQLKASLLGFQASSPVSSSSLTAISMDGKYLYGGCSDNRVAVWDLDDSNKYNELTPFKYLEAEQSPKTIAFSPKTMLMATADKDLSLWLPSIS